MIISSSKKYIWVKMLRNINEQGCEAAENEEIDVVK